MQWKLDVSGTRVNRSCNEDACHNETCLQGTVHTLVSVIKYIKNTDGTFILAIITTTFGAFWHVWMVLPNMVLIHP